MPEPETSPSENNIRAADPEPLVWNPNDIPGSLGRIKQYAEDAANRAASWYWTNKKWKARFSRAIQLGAMTSTALAGLLPVIVVLFPSLSIFGMNNGLAASMFVGLAAALIGVDKAFGLSSGWARYVLTATTIQKALEEFRMDWALLLAKTSSPPRQEDLISLLERAKQFTGLVEGMVLQETKDWVTEFQSNIAQLEKETQAQLDSLKARADKTIADRALANRAASVEIVVANADKIDDRTFQVAWSSATGQLVQETVSNAQEWIRINVSPGQYSAIISATIGGKPAEKRCAVNVNPGEHTKLEILLPLVLAAGQTKT